jgi:phosphoglycolate phosphatase-like HAD superfamily hydrolase
MIGTPLRGDEILVIGDTPRDVACGQAIDAKVLAVATGAFSTDQLRACRPNWVVPDLTWATAPELVV